MDQFPLLEFCSSETAIINPSDLHKEKTLFPKVVFCFFNEVLQKLHSEKILEIIHYNGSEIGRNPIYKLRHKDRNITVLHPGVGASLSGTFLEETIACGGTHFIACGGAGSLRSTNELGSLIIPEKALRDEGTSYHYLPASRFVSACPKGVAAIERALISMSISYKKGITWTTDGVYRETHQKIKKRLDEGCDVVEMESAAFFAISEFRKVSFAQILYCGDDVSGEKWDSREWNKDTTMREKIFWLAVESVLQHDHS